MYRYDAQQLVKRSDNALGEFSAIQSYVFGDFNGEASDFQPMGKAAEIAVWLSNGVGLEKQTQVLDPGSCDDCRLIAGDMDGDGRSELIAGNTGGVTVIYQLAMAAAGAGATSFLIRMCGSPVTSMATARPTCCG